MSEIKPFKGFCPIPKLAKLISSPPYDVINSFEAREMANNNPHSFLRVIKPEIDFDADLKPNGDDLHKHASINLQHLISKDLLIQDQQKSLYIYQIQMNKHVQTGLVAAVSVQEYNNGLIKIHEFTRPEKEDDRAKHIDLTNANTGPVFLTFKNDGQFQNKIVNIINKSPDILFTADDKTVHTIWKSNLLEENNLLIDYFKLIPSLYIADGHHRAASAARVQKIRQTNNPNHIGDEAYNYFLAVIFPNDEMKILDYNRVVKDLNGLSELDLLKKIESNFLLNSNIVPMIPNKSNTCSMYLNGIWYSLKAKDHIISDDPVEGLEVSLLQNYILDPILGIDNPRTNNRIDFVGGIRGIGELERRCKFDCAIAFALPPVKIEQLLFVADSGKVMPPKSTWFEPKLRSGLIVRQIN